MVNVNSGLMSVVSVLKLVGLSRNIVIKQCKL